jgi:hypothetical protein
MKKLKIAVLSLMALFPWKIASAGDFAGAISNTMARKQPDLLLAMDLVQMVLAITVPAFVFFSLVLLLPPKIAAWRAKHQKYKTGS